MRPLRAHHAVAAPALARLNALAPLDAAASAALDRAIARAVPVLARAELVAEGSEVAATRLIVSGWAARIKIMADGRRQLQSFLLPGDLIGMCSQPRPVAASTVVALTQLMVADAPPPDLSPALATAYAISAALEQAYLLAHITRLGRMHAQERIADLLLELHERLTLNGMVQGDRFEMPLTQELLGDALGLTAVHVNRVLQTARKEGDLIWRERQIALPDPAGLANKVGRTPVRVTMA